MSNPQESPDFNFDFKNILPDNWDIEGLKKKWNEEIIPQISGVLKALGMKPEDWLFDTGTPSSSDAIAIDERDVDGVHETFFIDTENNNANVVLSRDGVEIPEARERYSELTVIALEIAQQSSEGPDLISAQLDSANLVSDSTGHIWNAINRADGHISSGAPGRIQGGGDSIDANKAQPELEWLYNNGIRRIFSVACVRGERNAVATYNRAHPDKQIVQKGGYFHYHNGKPWEGSNRTRNIALIKDAYAFYKLNGDNNLTLIHCMNGQHRAVTMTVACYLVDHPDTTLADALTANHVNPNFIDEYPKLKNLLIEFASNAELRAEISA